MAFTTDIGLLDFYKTYEATAIRKGKPYKSYKEYTTILKLFNKKLRDKILYCSDTVELPYKLGKLGIKKFPNTYDLGKRKKWRVDFQETKKQGRVVYYGAEYGYKWKWSKQQCRVRGRKFYKFKPCRTASRLIADAIKNKNIDYYG